MAKATHGISVDRNTDTMTVTFKLVNKATEKVERTLQIDAKDVHENCKDFTYLYGITKILQDRESGADILDKLDAYQSCFDDTLKAGILARERKSGGPTVRVEVEALAKLKKLTVKQTQTLLSKYEKDDREKILTSAAVQAEVKKLAKANADEPQADAFDDLLSQD